MSIGISLRLREVSFQQIFRVAFFFGFFQFFMPILGWIMGQFFHKYIKAFDHWVAFTLLLAVGGKMIYESFRKKKHVFSDRSDPTKGLILFVLSVATSIDAFAVGISLSFFYRDILFSAAVIGIVAFILSTAGMRIGVKIGHLLGRKSEFIGGAILIIIGVKILTEHL